MNVGVLALGTRSDSRNLEKKCKSLGFKVYTLIKPYPTIQEIKSFFSRSYDWIYLGGHSSGHRSGTRSIANIYNERENRELIFKSNGIDFVTTGDTGIESTTSLIKGSSDLSHITDTDLLILGGCRTVKQRENVTVYRSLFGDPGIIGFKGSTSIAVCNAMFGASNWTKKNNFFTFANDNFTDINHLCNAWLKMGVWGWGRDMVDTFGSVDLSGRQWIIRATDEEIIHGFKV